MDEIGRGTSTIRRCRAGGRHRPSPASTRTAAGTLFATHYFELTRLAQDYPECANVHLDAVEHNHGIVFLHALEEGPASQSYGIEVAALAGIPSAVVPRRQASPARAGEPRDQRRSTGPTCSPACRRTNPKPPATRCSVRWRTSTRTSCHRGKPSKPFTNSKRLTA